MSSFTSLALGALLSTTAFALSPRQAPPNPGPCFNLQAQGGAGWVQIQSGGGSNFTTGLRPDRAQSTIFTLTDFVNNNFGAFFAVNAPGSPSKSVPLYPNGAVSAPVTWFNVAEATAQSGTQTSLRCQRQASTDFLVCQNVAQFTLCSGTLNGNTGATVPAGCQAVNLIYSPTTCPGPVTTSSMGMNSTSPTMGPTSSRNGTVTPTSTGSTGRPTNTAPVAPGTIGNWNLLGCANSPTGFLGWVNVASTPIMTNEYCTVSCTGYRYAGTNGANCYCADELEDVSTTRYPNSCTAPCPGNLGQACGGAVPGNGTSIAPRQLNLFNVLLTTYINLAFEPELPPVIIGDIIVNVDVVVYVDVCDTCAGGLTTCTTTSTCSTVACGCSTDVMPTIPLTTVTRPCDSCGPTGGPSTITVTIPVDVVTQQTQVVPPPGSNGPAPSTTMFMGGAPARREIGGAMGLIGAMVALLV